MDTHAHLFFRKNKLHWTMSIFKGQGPTPVGQYEAMATMCTGMKYITRYSFCMATASTTMMTSLIISQKNTRTLSFYKTIKPTQDY